MPDDVTAGHDRSHENSPRALVLLALLVGALSGLAEGCLVLLARYGLHRFTHHSRQVIWTAPISTAVLVAIPVALVAILTRRNPQRGWRVGPAIAVYLATYSVLLLATQLHPLARVVLAAGIAVNAGRMIFVRRAVVQRLVRYLLPRVATAITAIAVTFRVALSVTEHRAIASLPPAPAQSPSILLLILDTVRSMDLSLYGYARATTPEISRFAARGVVFDHAIAPAPWTLPSHASIFTGHPAQELSAGWRTPLDGRYPTLAEVLRDRGYLTGGFVANLEYTTVESGLSRGFDHYQAYQFDPVTVVFSGALARSLVNAPWVRKALGMHDQFGRRRAPRIHDELVSWLAGHRGRPYFAFLNFYDAHDPYVPRAPFDTAFTGRPVEGRTHLYDMDQTGPVSTAAMQPERDAYDQAILGLDHDVGAMLVDLEHRGMLHNTIVIIASDHGEEFGEHGIISHGNSLYLPALHVPLAIVYAESVPAGRRVVATVSLRDLGATVLDLMNAPASLPGTSLRATWLNPGVAPPLVPAIASVRRTSGQPAWFPASRGDMDAVVTDQFQLIRVSDGDESVFDLGLDPAGFRPGTPSSGTLEALRVLLGPYQR